MHKTTARRHVQRASKNKREGKASDGAGLFFRLGAGCTDAVDHHIGVVNGADGVEIIGELHGVKMLPVEVKYLAAGLAEEVVVAGGESLVPRLAFYGFDAIYQLELFKGGQGPVHCIKRQGRQPFLQPFVDGFGGGVVMGCQQFAIDLQTLMSHLQASVLAYLFKALQLWLEILGGHSVWIQMVSAKVV